MPLDKTPPRRERVERNIYRRASGVFEVGFKDAGGRQRWRTIDGGIMAARAVRDQLLSQRARGERIADNGRLRFADAAEVGSRGRSRIFAPQPRTVTGTRLSSICWTGWRCAALTQSPPTTWPISCVSFVNRTRGGNDRHVIGVTNRVYRYAARRLGWAGANPVSLMLSSERPKPLRGKRRRVFEAGNWSRRSLRPTSRTELCSLWRRSRVLGCRSFLPSPGQRFASINRRMPRSSSPLRSTGTGTSPRRRLRDPH